MFGEVTLGSVEHDPWPIVKLIDFGQARKYTDEDAENEGGPNRSGKKFTTDHNLSTL